MTFPIVDYPDPDAMQNALKAFDEEVTFLKEPVAAKDGEIETEYFIVGRDETVTTEKLGGVHTIRCHTFLSVGTVDVDHLKIIATNVVFANVLKANESVEVEMKGTLVAVGLDGFKHIQTNAHCYVLTPELKVEGRIHDTRTTPQNLSNARISIDQEKPIVAAIRTIKEVLQLQQMRAEV